MWRLHAGSLQEGGELLVEGKFFERVVVIHKVEGAAVG